MVYVEEFGKFSNVSIGLTIIVILIFLAWFALCQIDEGTFAYNLFGVKGAYEGWIAFEFSVNGKLLVAIFVGCIATMWSMLKGY